jgi:hypothetical protein
MIYVSGSCISANLKNRIIFRYRALFFADTVIPEIIEPSGGGLDIPTIIHGSAAEAINLSVYPEEIRNRIKDIFIKKISTGCQFTLP